jgi:hypothetical protein
MKREKLVRLFGAITAICLSTIACAFAEMPATPSVFPCQFDHQETFKFQYKIKEKYSYIFVVRLGYVDHDDLDRVVRLLGYETVHHPGIPLVIHLEIKRIDRGAFFENTIFDKVITTDGLYANGFIDQQRGYFDRKILIINLTPGDYVSEITILGRVMDFQGRSCQFAIDIDSWSRFLRGAVVPPGQ